MKNNAYICSAKKGISIFSLHTKAQICVAPKFGKSLSIFSCSQNKGGDALFTYPSQQEN